MPHIADAFVQPSAPGQEWSTSLEDERFGELRLSGLLHAIPGSRSLIVIVHGMGGHAEKSYVARAAQAAHAHGMSSLRLTLRGCDLSGEDIYHAGLVEDLQAAIRSPELASYRSLHVLGFSLGGHMVMRYALHPDARVRSAASICAPLSLDAACTHIDEPAQSLYRFHLLRGLRSSAREVERRRGVQLSSMPMGKIHRLRDWDDKIVAPRFGFASAEDYYRHMSVGPHVRELAVPSLLVWAKADPMVHVRDLEPQLDHLSKETTVRWLPGGHVRFPGKERVLEDVMRWLERYA